VHCYTLLLLRCADDAKATHSTMYLHDHIMLYCQISPNKTWEGFFGAMLFTIAWAYVSSGYLAQFNWFTCPVEGLTLSPVNDLSCAPDLIFQVSNTCFNIVRRTYCEFVA
jgi:hypothetical protein